MFFKKKIALLVVLIFTVVAAFLRLYRLPDTLQFLGDQGRDALRVARIFKQGDLVFIGPVTSIGNMYLGPLYYYFMTPWLWLTYPSPLGPAYAVAILGIVTVPLMYYLGKEMVGRRAALLATGMLTVSSVIVAYSRFSWNPNPAPLFGLLLAWSLHRAWTGRHWYWLAVAGSFAVLIQLHYLTLLTLFPILIVAGLQLWSVWKQKKQLSRLVLAWLLSILLVVFTLVPLILFDIRNGGINLSALQNLLGGNTSITRFETTSTLGKIWTVMEESHGRSMQLLFDMYIGKIRNRNTILVVLVLLLLTAIIKRQKRLTKGQFVITLMVVTAIAGTSFYSHSLYDHYVLYVVPAVFLFLGMLGNYLWNRRLLGKLVVIASFLYFFVFNLSQIQYKTASPSIKLLSGAARVIAKQIEPNERYNVVLLSETKDYYGQNYRYFLDTIPGKEPLNPDHDDLSTVETLVIINEEGVPVDTIASLPIFEISSFSNVTQAEIIQLPTNVEAYIWRK